MDAISSEVDGEDPNRAARPIQLGAAILSLHRHICAFFRTHPVIIIGKRDT